MNGVREIEKNKKKPEKQKKNNFCVYLKMGIVLPKGANL